MQSGVRTGVETMKEFNEEHIKNFKADGSDVVITFVADSKKINLNTLNEIAQNKLTVDFTSVQTELLPKKIEEK